MSGEDEFRTTENTFPGIIAPVPLSEDEIAPFLDAFAETDNDTQPLISTNGIGKDPSRSRQYLAAMCVTLGAFALGNVLSWSSPAGPYLDKEKYSESAKSWIGSSVAVGAAISVIPTGFAMDTLGHKRCMLLLVLPFVMGWLLMTFANDLWMFIFGRLITGMMGGAFTVTVPSYICEIADKNIRGTLGSFFQLMVTLGVLFVYILGSIKLHIMIVSGICAAVPLIFGVLFLMMPETPIHLLKHGKEQEAKLTLQWFRGLHYNVEDEIRASKDTLEKEEREKLSFFDSFSTKPAKKGLFIALGLMFFQQLSGVNAVIFYAAKIFQKAGSNLDPDVCTVIVGAVQCVATFVSAIVVDRLGRRFLLLLSDSIMSICCILLGVFFFLQDNANSLAHKIGWLPLISLCLFIIVFSLGFGPIPWMMVGELFPQNIKGSATSVTCMLNWIIAFIVTKFFPDIVGVVGSATTFWIFAAASAVGVVFVFVYVPETKGKSLSEIQRELGEGSTGIVVQHSDVT